MPTKIRIREGAVIIERNDGIFVGHLDKSIIFPNKEVKPLLHLLREWVSVEELMSSNSDQAGDIFELVTRLQASELLTNKPAHPRINKFIISHMNEMGMLLAPLLIESGASVTTLDSRGSKISDVRGQYLRISDIGQSYKEIIAAQKREIRNSGALEPFPLFSTKTVSALDSEDVTDLDNTLVIITTYPEPELLASLMSDGIDHFCAITTPTGGQIGPYVRPGVSPCFFCVELGRSDRDQNWQNVATSLFLQRHDRVAMAPALLTTSFVAELLLSGRESEIPHDHLVTTTSHSFYSREATENWGFHPECSCTWGRST